MTDSRFSEINKLMLNDFFGWEINNIKDGKFINMKKFDIKISPNFIKLYNHNNCKVYTSYRKDEKILLLIIDDNHILIKVSNDNLQKRYQIGYFNQETIDWLYNTNLENIFSYLQYLLS